MSNVGGVSGARLGSVELGNNETVEAVAAAGRTIGFGARGEAVRAKSSGTSVGRSLIERHGSRFAPRPREARGTLARCYRSHQRCASGRSRYSALSTAGQAARMARLSASTCAQSSAIGAKTIGVSPVGAATVAISAS